MKLDNRYWIYQLKCLASNKVYIGRTGSYNPCLRWSDHFSELRRGTSPSPGLQAEWNLHPDWTKWSFQVLVLVEGRLAANRQEAATSIAVPDELRLNALGSVAQGQLKRARIYELLDQGTRYIDIVKLVGVSLGTISNLKKERNEIHNDQRREDRRVLHDQR